jgi:peptidoglycan hydrolase-like protein with peptidoglycan-binding domain
MKLYETPVNPYDPEVATLQQQIVSAGIPIKVDGILGPETEAAAEKFRTMNAAPVAPVQSQVNPQVQASPVKPKYDPNSYLGGLIANRPKAPEYNAQSEEQLRNMAKFQKIGEFLGLLGDVYGVAKGAPVARRESTSTAPYMQAIIGMQQKHRDKLEQFDKEDYLRKLQIGKEMDVQKYKEQQYNLSKQKLATDQAYKEYLLRNKIQDSQLAREKFEADKAYKTESLNIQRTRANKPNATELKENKPIKIKTSKQVYELQPEEVSQIRDAAISDDSFRKSHPNYFSYTPEHEAIKDNQIVTVPASWELTKTTTDDDIVRAYLKEQESPELNYSGAGERALKGFNQANKNIIPNQVSTGGLY